MTAITNSYALINRITTAYTRATCHNPKSSIAENMEQAFHDCPDVLKAMEANYEMLSELKLALITVENAAKRMRDSDLMSGKPWEDAAKGYDQDAARIRAVLAKAEGR